MLVSGGIFLVLGGCGPGVIEPVVEAPKLPDCEHGVYERLTREAMVMPGANSESYQLPRVESLVAMRETITSLIAERTNEAIVAAEQAGYRLCAGIDDEAGLVLGEPLQLGTGEARFVWRKDPVRGLVLGAPHPWYDTDTLSESLVLFQLTEARVLIVAGSHRCANTTLSHCDGTTSVCGEEGAYRESDMAHVAGSFFQVAHEVFMDAVETDWVISIHGMAGDGISLSNGVGGGARADSPVGLIYQAFELEHPGAYITTCNEGSGTVVDKRLCGSTNVQGRYANGSEDSCLEASDYDSERFVHMEQSKDFRHDPESVSTILSTAWDAGLIGR
jgi:hypothetical protein